MTETAIDRGTTGRLPRPPSLADESVLDYLEGVRNFSILHLFPKLAGSTDGLLAAAGVDRAANFDELRRVLDPVPAVGIWKRLMRSQQQMTWQRIREAVYQREAELECRLAEAANTAPDRLHYSPDFKVPPYATYEIHLQPGGYVGDALAGYVFHHGTKVFYQGANDQDELHKSVAALVRAPEDGQVGRVLDLGCSIGQATTALKDRFPDAEVWGLDVALPMVRYAHMRAVNAGANVHFVQQLAEQTDFPAAHFDAVLAFILFHEVPAHLFPRIIAEVFRVLRPGGAFTIVDAPHAANLPAANRLWVQFDSEFNGEPYALDFVSCDLLRLLTEAGFRISDRPATDMFLDCIQCVKPA